MRSLAHVSSWRRTLPLSLVLFTACSPSESSERDSANPAPSEKLLGVTKAPDPERIEFNPESIPGMVAGEWHEKAHGAENYEIRHRLEPGETADSLVAGPPSGYAAIVGAFGDGISESKFKYLIEPQIGFEESEPKEVTPEAVPGQSPPSDKVSPALRVLMEEEGDPDASFPVLISLAEKLTTELALTPRAEWAAMFDGPQARQDHRDEVARRIELRQAEATRMQAPLVQQLRHEGLEVSPAGGIWLANALSGRATKEGIERAARHNAIARIETNVVAPTNQGWSGTHLRGAADFNAGHYYNAGQDGEEGNPAWGTNDLTIAVIDRDFNTTHPVFRDGGAGAPSRVREVWNCDNNPCTSGVPAPDPENHGTSVASVAAGDATDSQISGTATYREERSGVAREAGLILIKAGPPDALMRGLQKAIGGFSDVITESIGGTADCSGASHPWSDAIYALENLGVLTTMSAGNDGASNSCNLSGPATPPSGLVVGDLYGDGTIAYSAVDLAPSSANGPVGATINGTYYPDAFTQVGVAVMGFSQFCAVGGTSFAACAGTSHATPKIAGAGILFRHWAIDAGLGSTSMSPGWLRANLLAMADRADSVTTKRSSGFHKRWGAGRFQMRHYSGADHATWPWFWQAATFSISHGQVINLPILDSAAEPTAPQQVKVIALTREIDGTNAADVNLSLRTQNCAGTGTTLRSDTSKDYKSMVRYGSAAGGHQLCVQLTGAHVPAGSSRLVQVVIYYSGDTAMR